MSSTPSCNASIASRSEHGDDDEDNEVEEFSEAEANEAEAEADEEVPELARSDSHMSDGARSS